MDCLKKLHIKYKSIIIGLIFGLVTQTLSVPLITWEFGNAPDLLAGWSNTSGQIAQQGSPNGVVFNIDYKTYGESSTCHKIPGTTLSKSLSGTEKALTNTAKKLIIVKGTETYETNEYNFVKIITSTNSVSQEHLFIYSNSTSDSRVTITSNNGVDVVEVNISNIIGTNTVIEAITFGEGISDEILCDFGESYTKTRKYYSIYLCDGTIKVTAPTGGTYHIGEIVQISWICDPYMNEIGLSYISLENANGREIYEKKDIDIQNQHYDFPIECDSDLVSGNYTFEVGVWDNYDFFVSKSSNFEIVATDRPSVPLLNLPSNNATNSIVPVNLQWSNSTGASTYHLQISTNSSFTPILEDRPDLQQPYYTPTGLIGSTIFYWRVRAINNCLLKSDWSTVFNFTTAANDYSSTVSGLSNKMIYNSIRMAYCDNGEEMGNGNRDVFLQKAKDSKYNYVFAEFGMDRGRNTTVMTKGEDFKLAFKRANDFGLRLIPLVQLGSASAHHWIHAQENWNTNIKMTRITGTDHRPDHPFGFPSLCEDPNGFDKTFIELLQQVKAAHSEANVKYPLEFIHLGHDEPAYYTRILVGGCKLGAGNDWTVNTVEEVCDADRMFIQNYSGSKSSAVQELFVTELYRRTEQVRQYLGSNVKVMIYGDIWDPEKNGQRSMELWDGTIINTTPGIATLPGLTSSQKNQMRENLIILPWNYDITCNYDGDPYNANVTFNYLTTNGFKFIYLHEITNQDILPYDINRVAQANDYYNVSKSYKQNCLGYGAVHWDTLTYPVPKCYDTMWYLYNLNSSDLPLKDFKGDLTPVLNLLLND